SRRICWLCPSWEQVQRSLPMFGFMLAGRQFFKVEVLGPAQLPHPLLCSVVGSHNPTFQIFEVVTLRDRSFWRCNVVWISRSRHCRALLTRGTGGQHILSLVRRQ